MPQRVDIAITGSGSLGPEIVHALARAIREPLSVALLGRDMDRLATLARSAAHLVATTGTSLRLEPIVIDWSDDTLRRILAELRPKVLVHTASWQSPWTLTGMDQWSNLIRSVGFGFTLPLQSVLALRVARAIADRSPATVLINGCYPDAVNQILFANGLKVSGGLGNIAIIASLLWSGLPLTMTQGRRLRMVGHHAHLAAAIAGSELKEAGLKAWLDEQSIHDVAVNWFRNVQLQSNMNDIAAAAAVPMLYALLGRGPASQGHSAGPLGLPGGYPVTVDEGKIELAVPEDITIAEARTLNATAGIADGLIVRDDGYVVLAESSREALTRFLSDDVSDFMTWHASEVEERADRLVFLRKSISER
jgi:hypothetical protein